ncbi:MAG TPA: hypothetical protein DDY14_00590 [Chromatiaceae bacterium]|jgi:hypothetical protein|nr:MAG: hypothetical protein N838_31625 [Thiohalocapsa sp. PB-PSB1]HBG93831.1 hypothetical protein [Chromatiaceae bacterium]HCS88558.1 hypothetical protein [Chromatiaceae bacterium]
MKMFITPALFLVMYSLVTLGLIACVAPGFQGPGGSVQGTANVESLERQAPVTAAPNDAANAANAVIYGAGPRYYRGYPCSDCCDGPCDRRRYR